MINLQKIREDFPAINQEHSPGVPLVYLDNAASSQKPTAVIEALNDYYRRYNANVHRGIHKLSEEATAAYEGARDTIQEFINAGKREEVIYTRGTTEGINIVAQSWGRANLKAGDVILLTVMEHHSNIVPWQIVAEQIGAEILYVPLTSDGRLDLHAYKSMLSDHPVKLVAVMHGSNVLGTVNPIQEMAKMAHDAGALILVDGAQSVPHMPVDVQALDADFFVFSGHKMCGPTGIGILYGKEKLLDAMPPWMGGGDMISVVTLEGSTWNTLPHKFEAGTPIIAGAIGLAKAVEYLDEIGMDVIHDHERELTEYALERLIEVPSVTIYGPEDTHDRGAVTAFTINGIHAHDIAQLLDTDGIAVRAGHHCAMPLHQSLDLSATARASFYLYNTRDEIDGLINSLLNVKKLFGV